MEVLGNNSPLKESESGATAAATGMAPNSNYSCRLPRGVSDRHKNEADIGLLVACKVQLSSEVIRWKAESMRLQKERDVAVQKTKALDQTLLKLAEQTKELESRLTLAEDENRLLKQNNSTHGPPSDVHACRLAQFSPKLHSYHSFPWSRNTDKTRAHLDKKFTASCCESSAVETEGAEEDWRQVSERMMAQMKQEMRELRCCPFSRSDQGQVSSKDEESDMRELEELLLSAMSEAQSVKRCLLDQRRKLEELSNICDSGYIEIKRQDSDEATSTDVSSFPSNSHSHLTGNARSSEESYREHFSRQLGKTSNLNKIAKKVKNILKSPELNLKPLPEVSQPVRTPPQDLELPVSSCVAKAPEDETDKVCPICQMTFPPSRVTQMEFEQHVMNHLETESASLLDQYVVV